MTYFETIKSSLKNHIDTLTSIDIKNLKESSRNKIERHLVSSIDIDAIVNNEDPKILRNFIEYLENEGRSFGWSFPETKEEEICEDSFLSLKNKMRTFISGMTGNERLYYFGYLTEFENIPMAHKSSRDKILKKLFM